MDSKNPSISLQCFVTLACLFGFIHIIHGQKNDTSKVEYVFIIPEVPPQVKSGEENWHKWIQSNNRFYNSPVFGDEIAVVYIQYIVDSNNFIRDVQTIKGLGEPYDGEAERLVRECPLNGAQDARRTNQFMCKKYVPFTSQIRDLTLLTRKKKRGGEKRTIK